MNVVMIFLYGILLEVSAFLVYALLKKRKKKLSNVLAIFCYLGALLLTSFIFIVIVYYVELYCPDLLSIIEI